MTPFVWVYFSPLMRNVCSTSPSPSHLTFLTPSPWGWWGGQGEIGKEQGRVEDLGAGEDVENRVTFRCVYVKEGRVYFSSQFRKGKHYGTSAMAGYIASTAEQQRVYRNCDQAMKPPEKPHLPPKQYLWMRTKCSESLWVACLPTYTRTLLNGRLLLPAFPIGMAIVLQVICSQDIG